MGDNNQTNRLIQGCVTIADFIALWVIVYVAMSVVGIVPTYVKWGDEERGSFWMICTMSLMIAEYFFSTKIHLRYVSADSLLRRSSMLAMTQTLLSYLFIRATQFVYQVGWQMLAIGIVFLLVIVFMRYIERWLLKRLRQMGYNTRSATLVGDDREVEQLYNKMMYNASWGYRVTRIGVDDFMRLLSTPEQLALGDELFLCVSRKEREMIERATKLCNQRVVKFYYVPIAEELLSLEPTMFGEQQMFTTYNSPLEDPLNRFIKRLFDILLSVVFLIPTGIILPFVACIIKLQSPGPVFFRQRRTGLVGNDFYCYKFRSMHVNKDADTLQATKDDPRKFTFGLFMRKTNIDELPQFWNVLRGNMSIVGPRPHMLAHTEQYSRLIDKYMIRHFVKPGITGWAQVTGFRGETQHQWQMEGRVERDIWYIQHWSVWLDLRIIWMTVKTIFVHDENAY